MNYIARLKHKLRQSGIRGLSASALRHISNRLDPKNSSSTKSTDHQLTAYRELSKYTSFKGKEILEIGGLQSGLSAIPFLENGADSVIVSGLDHISQEKVSEKYNLRIQRADALTMSSIFGNNRFDIVYGLSVIEHIPVPEIFLEEVFKVLKPGGYAYIQGNPIWTSPKGHHLWVATWGGAYQFKATKDYLFTDYLTSPVPDWAHLLMSPDEMRNHLKSKSIPDIDISCIIDWIYNSQEINRLNMAQIAMAYDKAKLTTLEIITQKTDVPDNIKFALWEKHGDGIEYGICGVSYILYKNKITDASR